MTTTDKGTTGVVELRTYFAVAGRRDDLAARFRDHTLDLFTKHGIEVVAFWEPASEEDDDNQLVYLLAFSDREAARAAWATFLSDPEWKRVRAQSESDGPLVERVQTTFLRMCDFWASRSRFSLR